MREAATSLPVRDGATAGRCEACGGQLRVRRAVVCAGCGDRWSLPPGGAVERAGGRPQLWLARGVAVRVPLTADRARRRGAIGEALDGRIDCPDCRATLRVVPGPMLACAVCSTAVRLPVGRFVGWCACGLPWLTTPTGDRCLDGTCPVARPLAPSDWLTAGAGPTTATSVATKGFNQATVRTSMRVLSETDVQQLVSLADILPVVQRALIAQGRGAVERPERPHFPVGIGLSDEQTDTDDGGSGDARGTEQTGTGLAMPAYIHGDRTYATKLVGVHPGNVTRDLPTVQAQLVVTRAATGQPVLLAAAERLTNARTGAIGGLAAGALGPEEPTVGVIGAGTQARWQTRAIAATAGTARVRCYSPTPASRTACAADLRREGIDARAVESAARAVADADVVVTATTASEPVVAGDAFETGTLVIAVGAYSADTQELDRTTFDRAEQVYADVPEEVAAIGDVVNTGVDPARLQPLSTVFDGEGPPVGDRSGDDGQTRDDDGLRIVESVGSAVFDAAVGELLVDRIENESDDGVGTSVEL